MNAIPMQQLQNIAVAPLIMLKCFQQTLAAGHLFECVRHEHSVLLAMFRFQGLGVKP